MAKKRKQSELEAQRQSRKEILLARKQERQTRQLRLAIGAVIGLLAVVFGIGLVNELIIKPGQAVAVVNGVEITRREWQERVRFQRAQLVLGIEDLADTFGQDIGLVQQYAGQQINLLLDPVTMGQVVLDEMVDDALIQQGAEARGITVNDADVEKELEENFLYFGGASPTSLPTATDTVEPTPSLTPIPTAVITEVVPTLTPSPTFTPGPTSTPRPTATPVSFEAFQEDLNQTLDRFRDLGVSEDTYRSVTRARLYRERLLEELALEEEVPDEAEQASFFYLSFEDQDEATATLELVNDEGFLTTWNTIRSRPATESEDSTASASEVLWRTQESVESSFGSEVAKQVFEAPTGVPGELIVRPAETEEESDRYYIVQVSGREVRPLSESAINSAEQQVLSSWLEGQKVSNTVEIFERWRTNIPRQPALDPRFLVAPTQVPLQPTAAVPLPETTIPADTGPEQ